MNAFDSQLTTLDILYTCTVILARRSCHEQQSVYAFGKGYDSPQANGLVYRKNLLLLDLLLPRVFFIRYYGYKSAGEIKSDDVTAFLTYLAVSRKVSPNTQNQAFNALLFLFRHVLNMPLENVDAVRAKEVRKLPVVLSDDEVHRIVDLLNPPFRTMIQLAWGSGMRKMEIHRLRIKDVDFDRQSITIREGKGRKDRITVLPKCAIEGLKQAICRTEHFHRLDRDEGFDTVEMPYALAKKYPNQASSLHWKFIFCANQRSVDPHTGNKGSGEQRRHYLHPSTLARNLKNAVAQAQIRKKVSTHTFRHTFATQYLKAAMTFALSRSYLVIPM